MLIDHWRHRQSFHSNFVAALTRKLGLAGRMQRRGQWTHGGHWDPTDSSGHADTMAPCSLSSGHWYCPHQKCCRFGFCPAHQSSAISNAERLQSLCDRDHDPRVIAVTERFVTHSYVRFPGSSPESAVGNHHAFARVRDRVTSQTTSHAVG